MNFTRIFRKKNSLVVFVFYFCWINNFNHTFCFFRNNDYLIKLGAFFLKFFESITIFLNPLNKWRWVDCKWLTHKFDQNLRSLINLAWIFSFLRGTNLFLSLKISHIYTLKQVYWLTKARQDQASYIFFAEQAVNDTWNLKLKVIRSMDLFSSLNGFTLYIKFGPNTNF